MKLRSEVLAFLALGLRQALSAIVSISLDLEPDPTVVHFVRGALEAPATIDITPMKFLTIDTAEFIPDDADDDDDDDDDDDFVDSTAEPTKDSADTPLPTTAEPDTTSPAAAPVANPVSTESPTDDQSIAATPEPTQAQAEDTPSPTDPAETVATSAPSAADDGNRLLSISANEAHRILQEQTRKDSVLDFALFRLPDSCASSKDGCNWADSGVGVKDDTEKNGVSYCCSQDVYDRDLCERSQKGRLIIDRKLFDGSLRKLDFPASGEHISTFDEPDGIFQLKDSGTYVLAIANCNEFGREVLGVGKMEWKQERGFLPADLYGLMNFYIILAIIYLVTFILYGGAMRVYQDAMIPIQRFVVISIGLGLIELSFRALDLHIWDSNGVRSVVLMYPAIIVGVFKRGISRCLMVMVAMGWGIVRDSLGPALFQIILLGMIYTGLSGFRDLFEVIAATEVQTISSTEENELIDLVFILTTVIIAINVIFYFWIINNLKATSVYLENMNQAAKLKKHNQLRTVMTLSMVFAGCWLAFQTIDFLFNVLTDVQEWVLDASVHANYVFVLTSVAILWRPTPNAKDYAFVMELNTEDTDMDTDLELTAVPSAAGDDGNDPDHPNGLSVDDGKMT